MRPKSWVYYKLYSGKWAEKYFNERYPAAALRALFRNKDVMQMYFEWNGGGGLTYKKVFKRLSYRGKLKLMYTDSKYHDRF